jgi:SAM-dependent methyltransferase
MIETKEKNSEYYDRVYSREDSPYMLPPNELELYYAMWKEAAAIIGREERRFVKNRWKRNVVDIGCGPGHFARVLIDEGMFHREVYSYTGYDFSTVSIRMAKKMADNNRCEFILKDVVKEDLSRRWPNLGSKAIYVSFEFLEHVDKDIDVIKKIPSGSIFIFSVPNFDSDGHVRFFKDAEEVRGRYSEQIIFKSITEILHPSPPVSDPDAKIFLGYGTKR